MKTIRFHYHYRMQMICNAILIELWWSKRFTKLQDSMFQGSLTHGKACSSLDQTKYNKLINAKTAKILKNLRDSKKL